MVPIWAYLPNLSSFDSSLPTVYHSFSHFTSTFCLSHPQHAKIRHFFFCSISSFISLHSTNLHLNHFHFRKYWFCLHHGIWWLPSFLWISSCLLSCFTILFGRLSFMSFSSYLSYGRYPVFLLYEFWVCACFFLFGLSFIRPSNILMKIKFKLWYILNYPSNKVLIHQYLYFPIFKFYAPILSASNITFWIYFISIWFSADILSSFSTNTFNGIFLFCIFLLSKASELICKCSFSYNRCIKICENLDPLFLCAICLYSSSLSLFSDSSFCFYWDIFLLFLLAVLFVGKNV